MTGKQALQRLKEGNERFVEDKLDGQLTDSKRMNELTSGQAPYAIVLSCADSRVVPELAFDTGLGEIFVIRVAGNVANRTRRLHGVFGKVWRRPPASHWHLWKYRHRIWHGR